MSIKSKKVKAKVAGLAFYPGRKLDHKTFPGMLAWAKAGFPEPAYIYDNIESLETSGIPIADAIKAPNGMWIRKPDRINEPERVEVTLYKALTVELRQPVLKAVIHKFAGANTQDHNRMNKTAI